MGRIGSRKPRDGAHRAPNLRIIHQLRPEAFPARSPKHGRPGPESQRRGVGFPGTLFSTKFTFRCRPPSARSGPRDLARHPREGCRKDLSGVYDTLGGLHHLKLLSATKLLDSARTSEPSAGSQPPPRMPPRRERNLLRMMRTWRARKCAVDCATQNAVPSAAARAD